METVDCKAHAKQQTTMAFCQIKDCENSNCMYNRKLWVAERR